MARIPTEKAEIRVQQTQIGMNQWRIWLNGTEITDQCLSCEITFSGRALTTARIEVIVEKVNADG